LVVRFVTPFFSPKINNFPESCRYREIQLGEDYLQIIKKPKYGFGRNLNPCIDCKIFMLREAKKIMKEEGAGFIVTGEVLGQRPMSQKKNTFNLMEKEAGLRGLILRPLSAKLLNETVPEKEKVVDRAKLLNIKGRSRKIQLSLASSLGIKNYFTPSGGCLLTDAGFCRRLKDLTDNSKDYTLRDIELLRTGRHFRLSSADKLIISRDEKEAKVLLNKRSTHILIKPAIFDEPVGLFSSDKDNNLSLGLEIFSTYLYRRLKKKRETIAILYPHNPEKVIEIECRDTINVSPI